MDKMIILKKVLYDYYSKSCQSLENLWWKSLKRMTRRIRFISKKYSRFGKTRQVQMIQQPSTKGSLEFLNIDFVTTRILGTQVL